ncbi:MAG: glycosyltransferase [Nitrospinae bacterium]|nr:glycosyltransferase [Nitrospinota bacterium]
MTDKTSVCIVVPCYNEAGRLPVDEFLGFAGLHPEIHFCFVNDGSTDGTSELFNSMAVKNPVTLQFLDFKQNCGKAEAVRKGTIHALRQNRFGYVGFWDADLSTPLAEIPRFILKANADPKRQLLAGSRIRRMGAIIDRHWYRHYFGRVFATCASVILDMPVYDTQCGAKLVRSQLASRIFGEPFVSKWFFDVELFARTVEVLGKSAAVGAIYEIPLKIWEDKAGSKVSLKTVLTTPLQLLLIRRSYPPSKRPE